MNRLIISYSLFLILLALFSYLFLDPNFFYFKKIYTGFVLSNRPIVTLAYLFFVLVFFVFYSIFLKGKFNPKLLIGITCIILFFSYSSMLSQDIFNYLTTAKVTFKYFENPYLVMPIEFKGDTNLLFTHGANRIALYGPFWIFLSAIPYFLGFGNLVISFFNFKFFIILFYLGTLWLINKLVKNDLSVVLFALNPLVITETLIGNHNDIVMMFFALFSFYILKKNKILLACLLLIASIFIKYATIFLVPVFLFVLIKKLRKQEIFWNKIFFYCSISMILIFLLSATRVEIYPWYAIWFLAFSFLIPQKRILLYISLAFSLGLLLRYIPFMFFGTHFGITPAIKTFVTFLPVSLALIYGYFKRIY